MHMPLDNEYNLNIRTYLGHAMMIRRFEIQAFETPALNIVLKFYIHDFVHRKSILIRSNKMQQYAGIYLLQNHSTCFGCPSHPSSGVHKTVTAASGTGHSI